MPEAGYLPIPARLARAGVKDMVRISDARMSGTAFGTIVLHITPESAVGGPLALVRNGDMIRLDVAKRSIDLLVDAGVTPAEVARARGRGGRDPEVVRAGRCRLRKHGGGVGPGRPQRERRRCRYWLGHVGQWSGAERPLARHYPLYLDRRPV